MADTQDATPAEDRLAVTTVPAEIDATNGDMPRDSSPRFQAASATSDDGQSDAERRGAVRGRARDLQEQAQRLLAQSHAQVNAVTDYTRDWLQQQSPQARKDLLRRSAYARLVAQLETMPVIEQAKGIIMGQSHCGEADAFDLLRRASQRSNVPVRDLAAQIVAKTTQSSPRLKQPQKWNKRRPRRSGHP